MKTFLSIMCCISVMIANAQQDNIHEQSSQYIWPEDPQVRQKLEEWQDLKFGMIIHWGLYAQAGIVESWELTSEDWINRKDSMTHCEYKEWYWGLKDEFNPKKFDPEQWAESARTAGMKYVVFTTKHHDGFNLFDTQQTDFKITNGPFAVHPKANVAQYVFEAFRQRDMMIGAYFSKPDWHSQYFWWDKYATDDRNVNYNLNRHADRWEKFQQFAYNQIEELMTDYGSLDILWLDGGWVRPGRMVHGGEQHIDLPRIAAMARKNQPGLLIVDRTVHGPYENYQTPERTIPETRLEHPWESCIPLHNNWGYVPGDQAKSSRQIIHSLVEVVAKGGSLLLGIGPKPDGLLLESDRVVMEEIGSWLQTNGSAIYGTRSVEQYRDGEVFFTRDEQGNFFAIARIQEIAPGLITWRGNEPQEGGKMTLMQLGAEVSWKCENGITTVQVPRRLIEDGVPALSFQYTPK
ncbi:alpha-L-fucosidase [Marinoscillum sp.]|uniref:alpha-L-fucosidase n=1 Tax=Marinoscillum sp. TaxID=2024838 RepID=UPI003BAA163D